MITPRDEVERIHGDLVLLERDTPKMAVFHKRALRRAIERLALLRSCVPAYPQKPRP